MVVETFEGCLDLEVGVVETFGGCLGMEIPVDLVLSWLVEVEASSPALAQILFSAPLSW